MTVYLKKSLAAWNCERFEDTFKSEVADLSADQLLLQQALRHGSHALMDDIKVMINRRQETSETLVIDVGIFFTSVISGCSCADDPTPQDILQEYCELRFSVEKVDASTVIQPK